MLAGAGPAQSQTISTTSATSATSTSLAHTLTPANLYNLPSAAMGRNTPPTPSPPTPPNAPRPPHPLYNPENTQARALECPGPHTNPNGVVCPMPVPHIHRGNTVEFDFIYAQRVGQLLSLLQHAQHAHYGQGVRTNVPANVAGAFSGVVQTGRTGQTGQTGQSGQSGQTSQTGQTGQTGQVGQMSQMTRMAQLSRLAQMTTMAQMNPMGQRGQMSLSGLSEQQRAQLLNTASNQGHGYHRHQNFSTMGGQAMFPGAGLTRTQASTHVPANATTGAGQDEAIYDLLEAERPDEHGEQQQVEEQAEHQEEGGHEQQGQFDEQEQEHHHDNNEVWEDELYAD